jgi:methylenetetrahydrofolate reductase (NADPH)
LKNERQLEMTFEADTRLRERLYQDDFTVLLEIVRPNADQPFQLGMLPVTEVVRSVATDKRIHGLVLTGGFQAEAERHSLVDTLAGLKRERKKLPVMAAVSGTGLSAENLSELVARLKSAKVSDLLLVSGFAKPSPLKGDFAGHPGAHLDSTLMLQQLHVQGLTLAATVNPFKYNIADTFLQYYKMARKIKAGAHFFVTEAGWDMKKIQELLWYSQQRNYAIPVIARLRFVRPQEVVPILDGLCPGQVMSREFAAQLQREANVGDQQAEAAQLRRLALQATGCRLLGCSGVQIAGIEDPARLQNLLNEIDTYSQSLTTYKDWLRAWNDYHDRVEMAPYPRHYYAYKNLLDESLCTYNAQHTLQAHNRLPQATTGDRVRYLIADALSVEKRTGSLGRILRKTLCLDASDQWQLAKTFYVPASQCPKGLEEGPCGGTRPDGTCEIGDRPCMYHQCLARARWLRRLDEFEEI